MRPLYSAAKKSYLPEPISTVTKPSASVTDLTAGFSESGLPPSVTCPADEAGIRTLAVELAGISTFHDKPCPSRLQRLAIGP